MEKLCKIHHLKQESTLLLRSCLNSKAFHLCRTIDPRITRVILQGHDYNVNCCLRKIFPEMAQVNNTPFDEWPEEFKRARLPIRLGGLGIHATTFMPETAFLSSVGLCWTSMGEFENAYTDQLLNCLNQLKSATAPVEAPRAEYFPIDIAKDHSASRGAAFTKITVPNPDSSQRDLRDNLDAIMQQFQVKGINNYVNKISASFMYDLIMKDISTKFESSLSVPYRLARFLSQSCREASLWSVVVPCQPELMISPNHYKLLVSRQLGINYSGFRYMKKHCECRADLQKDPHHVLNCYRTHPHDQVVSCLQKFCQAAGLNPIVEPHGICTTKRPDILVPAFDSEGKDCIWDFTSGDPCALVNLNKGSFRTYHTANEASAKAKQDAYRGTFNESAYNFQPLSVETSGRWSPDMHNVFGRIKNYAKLNRHGNVWRQHAFFVDRWRKRLATTFAKSQARSGLHVIQSLIPSSAAHAA